VTAIGTLHPAPVAQSTRAGTCLHCGTPSAERFCCAGCAAAHGLVSGLGLDAFYRRATAAAGSLRPDPTPPVPLAPHAVAAADGAWQLDLMLAGLSCGACVWLVEQALAAEPDVTRARAALTTRRLVLSWRGARDRAEAFAALLARLGFRAVPFSPPCIEAADDAETRAITRALGIAAFGAMNVMLVSVAVWVGTDMGEATRAAMHWLAALIGLPTIAVAGLPFYRRAWASIRARRANMDVAISIAVLATAAMSLSEALRNGPYTWFDGATTLLALLLAGRLLDRTARARAGRSVAELLALQQASVRRLGPDGTLHEVAAESLAVGDRLLLAAGERLPADASVDSDAALFDLSALTGESLPQPVARFAPVAAGAVNMGGATVVRVARAARDGSVAAMARMLEAATAARGRFAGIADAASRLYVPAVLAISLATFLLWWLWLGTDWRAALVPAVAALIITCPCGLAIAVPAVQAVAVGAMFRRGLLVTSPTALERISGCDHVVLDKTGTLTEGRPVLLPGSWTEPLLREAAGLAHASRHPLAQALAAACPEAPAALAAVELPGRGIMAGMARLGSAAFVGAPTEAPADAPADAHDGTVIWYAAPGIAPVRFAFADTVRSDAAATIAALRGLGLSSELLSGDQAPSVAAVADALGIADWTAGATPEAKAERVLALQQQGRRVLMVGDGINDAPALALARASASPESGTDLARTTADVVLRQGGLSGIVEAIRLARRAQRLARQNIAFSLAYNVLAVPFAVAGLVTPLIAAMVMATSSLAVTLNALRAGRAS
jgi:Cu2+-exporting ATPase